MTSAPISTREVTSAQAPSMVQHSKCLPSGSPFSGKKWSQLKITSTPSSSASTTARRMAAQSPCWGWICTPTRTGRGSGRPPTVLSVSLMQE